MSITAVAPVEQTVHLTNAWLQELKEELGLRDHQRAYHALRAVLHALRDRLNQFIADNRAQIARLLGSYGVPLVERQQSASRGDQ